MCRNEISQMHVCSGTFGSGAVLKKEQILTFLDMKTTEFVRYTRVILILQCKTMKIIRAAQYTGLK